MNSVENKFWDDLAEKNPNDFEVHLELQEAWAKYRSYPEFDALCKESKEVADLAMEMFCLGYVSYRRNIEDATLELVNDA